MLRIIHAAQEQCAEHVNITMQGDFMQSVHRLVVFILSNKTLRTTKYRIRLQQANSVRSIGNSQKRTCSNVSAKGIKVRFCVTVRQ